MLFVYFCAVVIFCLGVTVGSFLNVCIYRLPIGESIVTPPSHCPKCNKRLIWIDLVPLLSFLFLGRKCRYCGQPISWRYFTVELLTGILFLASFLRFGFAVDTCFYLIFIAVLIVGAFVDIDHMIIPDWVVVFCLLLGLAKDVAHFFCGNLVMVQFDNIKLFPSLVGAVLCGGLFYLIAFLGDLIFRPRNKDPENDEYYGALGLGDVSLAAGIGAVIGYGPAFVSFLVAVTLGAVCGIIWMLLSGMAHKKGLKWREAIPFGPYMVIGAFSVMFFMNSFISAWHWWLGLF